ncbi:MAG TPA: hypothetical protein VGC97_22925 [Pyrinomonadaceae bacterium]|jgi:hypothetical protein
MKRCQKCNFQSEAMLDYCWQCGAPLSGFSNGGGVYQGARPTQESYSVPNQQFNCASQYQPRTTSVSLGRAAAVLGGIFFVLFLISGIGAAVVYRIVSRPSPVYERDYAYRNPEPVKPQPVKENPVNERRKSDKPNTEFEKIWVDYNVRENGRLGMRIHVKFTVNNMKDVDSYMAVYFEKADGAKLISTNRKFSSDDGQAAVFRATKPGYDETVYKDLDVFMPYDELKLGRGRYDLKMDVDLIYENGDLVEHLAYHDFEYEKK